MHRFKIKIHYRNKDQVLKIIPLAHTHQKLGHWGVIYQGMLPLPPDTI